MESVNLFLHACNRDSSISLPIGIVASNISGTNKIHISAKSYSSNESHEENKDLYQSDYDVTAGPKTRSKWLSSIQKKAF